MTRQEAKEILERMPTPFSYGHTTAEAIEAIDMAIKALKGDMYCPSCGVRLVSENEYVEPRGEANEGENR